MGFQSREIRQVTTGSLSDQLESTRRMQTPTNVFFIPFHRSLLLFLKYHSSRQRLHSHGTTATLQPFPFVTATNGASAYGFVSMRVCARVVVGSYSSRNQERSMKNRGAIQLYNSLLVFIYYILSAAAAVCPSHTVAFAVVTATVLLCACITP